MLPCRCGVPPCRCCLLPCRVHPPPLLPASVTRQPPSQRAPPSPPHQHLPAASATTADDPSATELCISSSDLCAAAVDVCGVVLPFVGERKAEAAAAPTSSPFVPTPSAVSNLRSVAMALTLHMPVLLEGVTGAGKTALLEHLARLTGHTGSHQSLLKIQMGDQTDAKVRKVGGACLHCSFRAHG